MTELTLLPQPQSLEYHAGTYVLTNNKLIAINTQENLSAARRLQGALQRLGLTWDITMTNPSRPDDPRVSVRFIHSDEIAGDNARYVLNISEQGVTIGSGDDAASYFYGTCTLIQILEQRGVNLPVLRIEDWPDFPRRGVMLDISRDRVPTMETLYALIDKLAGWKLNEVQLYTEHTFAYGAHRKVWEHASPMTPDQILALDAYCRERFVDLVPNQASFGHMHRWLMHDEYKHMAEVPEGIDLHFMLTKPRPFSLSPVAPESLPLVESLFDELLPNFSSKYFNVNCDETFDLGKGRSKALCEEKGRGRVYLDFLKSIKKLVAARGRSMMFWGDIIMEHPELIPELREMDGSESPFAGAMQSLGDSAGGLMSMLQDAMGQLESAFKSAVNSELIALEWGYEADHPFEAHGAKFAESGIRFYVCPGTSSWISLIGRTDNAIGNLRNAALNGRKHGAIGYLITDWGDYGHTQPLPVSYLGFGYGAALSWAYDANENRDLSSALDLFAFEDKAGVMGKLADELGRIYREYDEFPHHNGALMVRALFSSLDSLRAGRVGSMKDTITINADKVRRAINQLDSKLAKLDAARPADPHIVREYRLAAALWKHGCKRLLMAAGDQSITNTAMAAEIRVLMAEYSAVWLLRSRQGGLGDSLARLARLLAEYEKA